MSRVAIINGSPKAKDSASGMLIEKLQGFLDGKPDVYRAARLMLENSAETLADMVSADALIIVFPLYVDSLPAPLIEVLERLERAAKSAPAPPPTVYGICNCGFFEAGHTDIALQILRNFARRAGFNWGYGIGIGAGGFSAARCGQTGPAAALFSALGRLGESLSHPHAVEQENVFVTPGIPRVLYLLGAHMGWRQMSRQNGVRRRIRAKPHDLSSADEALEHPARKP